MTFTGVFNTPQALFAGVAADNVKPICDAFVNSEASQEMPFGTMLVQGATDSAALVAAAQANKMIGILRNQFAYMIARGSLTGELGTIGLKPKTALVVATKGRMTVVVGEAVTPSSPVRVRMDTNAGALGATNGPGTFCTTSSAGHTVRLPFARFKNSTSGAGVAILEFDMTMRDQAVSD